MGRWFIKLAGTGPVVPENIWDVIKHDTYEPQEGWVDLTNQTDDGVMLNPTVEAGVVNALQEECGRTAAEHGFSRDWLLADFLEVVGEWLAQGNYQIAEMYVDIDRRPPEDLSVEEGRESAGEVVKLTATTLRNNIIGTKLMLIVTELAEGLESLRENGGIDGALDGRGNLAEELADTIVRVLDTGTFIRANLGDDLLKKMAINRDRPHMHGDKTM